MKTLKKSGDLLSMDDAYIWHPYSPAPSSIAPHLVKSAKGTRLQLDDGCELIDGMSSWWAVIHGYNHPVLNQALKDQLDKMAHVMFGGLTHEPAILLAEKLAVITPPGLSRVFFCDSGSVAVEVAIKMALQYWLSLGRDRKKHLLTIRQGYHGDTFGAMSVCDPVNGMHHLFSEVIMPQFFAAAPECRDDAAWDGHDIEEIKNIMAAHSDEIAALILEPIVQGAGGMRFYCPEFLRQVRALCDEYDLLLIADEIATGFGRTGKLFACEHAGVSPDILCVGKAITGGYMSFAATLTNEKISEVISTRGLKMLMHGPTYMANPLACSVALASIGLLESYPWEQRIAEIEALLEHGLSPCRFLEGVKDVRVLGAIGVIETHEPVQVQKIQDRVMKQGVWLRPFGHLIYTMPPYIASDSEIEQITHAMCTALAE
ncbi:MAG: adenosylmethionine--8-amino-7-oxononanoate transaminase [Deltaproteobacteria bacterium]|nr:adenosylmethionine--8-amino-7-oxononanoate transaminase [Candidatus Tharpellaceae bacterium]